MITRKSIQSSLKKGKRDGEEKYSGDSDIDSLNGSNDSDDD